MLQAYFQTLYKSSTSVKIYKKTHCINISFLNHRKTVVGSTFRVGSSFSEVGGTTHDVFRIIEHPLYDWWSSNYDIAVAKVSDNNIISLISS
jgi:hypothetical protein